MPSPLTPLFQRLGAWAMKAGGGSVSYARLFDALGDNGRWTTPDLSVFSHQADLMQQSAWVYIAVNIVAQEGAQVEFEIFRNETQLETHAILDLFKKPNGWQSEFEVKQAIIGFYQLTGNAYLFVNKDKGGNPLELMLLRPDRVKVVPGKSSDKFISGYIYTVGSTEVPLEADEVIHFKRWHPKSDYYGLSPLQAAAVEAQTDLAMAQWNRQFFGRDMAIPAGIVDIKQLVDEKTFNEIKSEWRALYGGQNRKTAFIRGSEIDYKEIGISQKEMDFLQSRQFSKETILQIFGVPPGMLDKNATEANATVAERILSDKTLWPIVVAVGQTLTARLAPMYEDGLAIKPKDFRVKDTTIQRAEIQAATPFLSINEIRAKYYQMPPVDWGDKPAQGSGAGPSGGGFGGFGGAPTIIAPKPDELPGQDAQQQQPKQIPANVEVKAIDTYARLPITRAMQAEIDQFARYAGKRIGTVKAAELDNFTFMAVPEALEIALRAYADVCHDAHDMDVFAAKIMPADQRVSLSGVPDPYASEKVAAARQLKRALQTGLDQLQSDVIAGIRHVGKVSDTRPFDDYFNNGWWKAALAALAAALYAIYDNIVHGAAADYADLMSMRTGIDYDPATITGAIGGETQDWIDSTIRDVLQTTRDGLRALIQRWAAAPGANLALLVASVQESPLFTSARADLIAETETNRAFFAAALIAAMLIGKGAKVKLAFGATRTDQFPPLHPNCRCFVEPELVYETPSSEQPTLMDMRWHAVKDDRTCIRCEPRDGLLISEIIDKGLA